MVKGVEWRKEREGREEEMWSKGRGVERKGR